MNVFRLTNFYNLRRNLSPDYVFCASVYQFDRNVFSKRRALPQKYRELYTINNKIEERNAHVNELRNNLDQMRMLHFTPKLDVSADEVITQVLSMFRSIRMQDLKNVPQPIFWCSAASLIPLLVPPLTFLIFGYSRFLSSAQVYYAAVLCSFIGGTKLGYALGGKEHPATWENCGLAHLPQLFGWLTMLLPNSIGYIVVISGIAISTYVDLTMVNFPGWYRALRLAVTIFALFGLFLSFLISIFH